MTGRRRAAGRPTAAVARVQRRWAEYQRRSEDASSIDEACAAFDVLRATWSTRRDQVADAHVRAAAREMVARARRMEGTTREHCA